MSTYLITGGAGFIGLHLARHLLAEGHRVDLLDSFARGRRDRDLDDVLRQPAARLLAIDLGQASERGSGLSDDYTHVVHLAAILGVRQVMERPFDVLRDNVRMLVAALELAREQARLQRFVFASTSEVYAGTLHYFDLPLPTPEDVPLAVSDLAHPRTSYMLSKIYGEALCRQSGLPFTIVRPHNVYGPRMGMAHVVPELLRRLSGARDGDELELISSDHRRTFCYVSDAVNLIARLSRAAEAMDGAFNVGCESPEISVSELAGTLARVVGRRVTFRPGPTAPGSVPRRCPSLANTDRVSGFLTRVALEEGAARTFAWYREAGLLHA